MSEDHIRRDPFDVRLPQYSLQDPGLPPWIARRLLRQGEVVTWVRGPRGGSWWERCATDRWLFVIGLMLGAACFCAGWLAAGRSVYAMAALPVLAGGGFAFGSVLVLGLANAHYTRLVVTNLRLLILQGYEVCKVWNIDE